VIGYRLSVIGSNFHRSLITDHRVSVANRSFDVEQVLAASLRQHKGALWTVPLLREIQDF
jgi:hypothetical protein